MRQVPPPDSLRRVALRVVLLLATMLGACGEDLYVGSDLLWIARHETGDLTEWTNKKEGRTVWVAPNELYITQEHVHTGKFGLRLNISAPPDAVNTSASLIRDVGLPAQAYYSAWYFIPQPVTVGTFWVLMKFRKREGNDSSTEKELLDLDLQNNPNGDMSLYLYDHRISGEHALEPGANAKVPVGTSWFQIEAYYRNTPNNMARATFWLDGQLLFDVKGDMLSPTPWVEWEVGSVGKNLTPSSGVSLFVDDAAISSSRVGPTGLLVR